MKILNVMLSRSLGGIQQVFLDYNCALITKHVEVINITSIFAKINNCSVIQNHKNFQLLNLGIWDIISSIYLKLIIHILKPNAIIAHGNRAITLLKRCSMNYQPLIGVAHNYNIKHLKSCDYIIALTQHIQQYLISNNFNKSKITVIQNMLQVKKDFNFKHNNQELVIGILARFVKKKGIHVFLHAIQVLKNLKNYDFKVIIGGDGPEKKALINMSNNLGLSEDVTFLGWIDNKKMFFDQIDIFCVPSLHEPFGLVLLEAMESSTVILTSNTEGPKEIIRNMQDGLFYDSNSFFDLAAKLAFLINHKLERYNFSKSAYLRLKEKYDMKVVSLILTNFVKKVAKKYD